MEDRLMPKRHLQKFPVVYLSENAAQQTKEHVRSSLQIRDAAAGAPKVTAGLRLTAASRGSMKMKLIPTLMYFSACLSVACCEDDELVAEDRGKKKKYALFLYVAHLVLKKIFIIKIFYAFVFWVILHKAGYLFSWFISYLKDKKKEYVEHHDHDHDHDHGHYHGHFHDSYGPYYEYGSPYDNGYKGGYGHYKRKNGFT
ncbi:hypothetical protein EVAR_70043_1 [Eumeta japonica]|uniref:Uncharacterized protein n=1 Tax=Eumeta variegata TaxID=151549 RepID=A0A4C2ABY5_EUMVA|nr:hypothetical protein EVAR_70043_1 [Eumeta japonica]